MSHRLIVHPLASLCVLISTTASASAATIVGDAEILTPLGQRMEMSMTISELNTTFRLTGPDFSYFAFGFDTTTMFGYSLIVTGIDANRTIVEQNLLGTGNPGNPQASQDISVIEIVHDAANNLTTVLLERPNQTGDAQDPVFSTAMMQLDVIWSYNSFASPDFPNPTLFYHGIDGRGSVRINLTPVPEPKTAVLLILFCWMPFGVTRR